MARRNALQALHDAAEAAEYQWQAKALNLASVEAETQRFEDEAEHLKRQRDERQGRLAELSALVRRNREYLSTNGVSRVVAEKTAGDLARRRRELSTEILMTEAKIEEMKAANTPSRTVVPRRRGPPSG